MAWGALFKAELFALSSSWVLRGWIIALGLTEFFLLSGTLLRNRVEPVPASSVLAGQLDGYLLVWSLVIIVIGAGSISMEANVIADSILSRACTRTQYILAKLLARALAVGCVYLVSSGIAAFCAWRYAANDMTLATMFTGISIVGLAVLLLLAIGIALSVIFNNTVFAIVGTLLLWYVASPIFNFVGANYLSPTSLVQNLPQIMKDPNQPQVMQVTATPTSMTVVFSKELNAAKAEEPGNYLLEGSDGALPPAQTAVYDKARGSVVLSGLDLPAGQTIKVTVRNVTDIGGSDISPAADSASTDGPIQKLASDSTPDEKPDTASTSKTSKSRTKSHTKPDPSVPATPEPAPNEALAALAAANDPGSGKGKSNASGIKKKSAKAGKSGDHTPPRVTQCSATTSSVRVTFSKEMDPKDAEIVAHYIVENPPGHTQPARAATYSSGSHTVLLSGLKLSLDSMVKVTARDVTDSHGNAIGTRGNSATYADVTTWKYLLGLGIPTLVFAAIAMLGFARRDL